MAHEIRRGWKDKLLAAVPFRLGQTKPQHFAEIPVIAWKNRDNLPSALLRPENDAGARSPSHAVECGIARTWPGDRARDGSSRRRTARRIFARLRFATCVVRPERSTWPRDAASSSTPWCTRPALATARSFGGSAACFHAHRRAARRGCPSLEIVQKALGSRRAYPDRSGSIRAFEPGC